MSGRHLNRVRQMGTVLHVRPSESADGAWAGGRVRVRTATTVAAAVAALEDDSGSVDCVVVERRLGEETALAVVEAVRERRPDLPVVCCSGAPDGEFAAAATRRGASEYFHRETGDASLADRVRTYLPDAAEAGEGGITEDGAVDADAALAEADGGLSVAVGAGTDGAASSDDGARMAALLDAVEDGLYVLDAEGRFEAVNEAMAALTGYSVERLVGSHVSLIVDEATAERAVAEIERLHESDVTATTFETTIDPADGDPFAAEDHLTLLTDDRGEITGLAGVVRDVSDRREREAELERYASIIEAVDDAVYALDDQGRFEVINDALTDLTGYDREELLGEHTAVIKDDATVAKAEDKLRELLRGRDVETTFELQLQRESGSPVTCEDHMTMLTDDGDFDGTAGVIRDITDRKERERQLRRARERLADLLDSSEALLDAHSREAVAEVVTNAAADALGFDHTLVRLYDPDGDRLTAVSGSGNGGDETDRPTYAADEGGPGAAFAAGEIRHYPADFEADGADADVDLPPEIVEALYVPLGDRGVLSIGATERGAFDERDRSMVEILASNAAVALERVSYESELVQYRTVLENVQDMVYVVDEDERFSLVTDPLAAWLGYDSEELVGAHPSEVLDETETEAFESVIADIWHEAGDGTAESRTVETELFTADGESRQATVNVSLLPAEEGFAGSVGVVRDRSDLREARAKLQAQRDRFSYLFDNLPDAVVEGRLSPDREPVITDVNDAFVDVFGYESETVIGESLNDYVLPPDEREEGAELDRRTAAGETVQQEVRRRTADGYRDFLFRGIPYDTSGERTRGFGIYTDITDQKERERRLEVLNRVLRHNLRNDLNVVLGYAEMLANRVEDDTVAEWAGTLHEKASEVATLGDRVRSLDQQMRRGSSRDDTVDVAAAVADVVEGFRADYEGVTVETDVPGVDVVGDGRLTLALSELLENSAEHVPGHARVRVAATCDDGRVALRVADDGPGIPEQERDVVTETDEITQLNHGSGLGLWIVKWVCDSCGGRLHFEESDLGGTAVVLSLTPAGKS